MINQSGTENKILLELNRISAFYGSIQVLFDVSIKVPDGSVVALLGRNAAGKTTTMSTITGLVRARTGTIFFENEDISQKETSEIVRKGIMMVPEGRRIFPEMTVFENLQMGAFIRKKDKSFSETLEYVYALFPRLAERKKQLGGTLSGGEQQMLATGRGLMASPRVLLMDEPSMGLAPVLVDNIFDTIRQLHATGTTILLVEQNARMALKHAHRGYVLETGRVTLSGTGEELLNDPRVRAAYLGE